MNNIEVVERCVYYETFYAFYHEISNFNRSNFTANSNHISANVTPPVIFLETLKLDDYISNPF